MIFKGQAQAVGSRLWKALRLLAVALALALASAAPPASAGGPAILIEAESGKVLYASQAFEPWYPASLTKMMTAFVAFRAIESGRTTLSTPLLISQNALNQPPSKIGFPVGSAVTLEDALRLLMVKSANDIAVAIAEGISGSVAAFADEMNLAARELGMTGSSFVNPNGLPDERQFSTARDFALLARAMLDQRYASYHDLYRLHGVQFGRRLIRTHNSLVVRYPGATGLKTGFVCSAGYNLVASAKRNGRELIAVVLGARSGGQRAEIAAALLEQGFAGAFESVIPFFNSSVSIQALQPETTPRAAPFDMRPYVCSPRRRMTPEEAMAFYAIDPKINLDLGRQALGGVVPEEPEAEAKDETLLSQTATPTLIPLVRLFRPTVSPDQTAETEGAAPAPAAAGRRGASARAPRRDLRSAVRSAIDRADRTTDQPAQATPQAPQARPSRPAARAARTPAPAGDAPEQAAPQQPAGRTPAEARPAEARPAEARPAEAKPAEARPAPASAPSRRRGRPARPEAPAEAARGGPQTPAPAAPAAAQPQQPSPPKAAPPTRDQGLIPIAPDRSDS